MICQGFLQRRTPLFDKNVRKAGFIHRRPDLPRQRAPYAPPGSEAGGTAQSQVPRPPAHVRHPGPSKRRGHQDGVRDAGTFLGRIHPGPLRPRHDSSPEGGGQDHGEGPDGGNLKAKK